MGKHRELTFALEKYWSGGTDEETLLSTAKSLRREHWKMQVEAAVTVGAMPRRFNCPNRSASLATYFAMARGSQQAPALEMTKWFDTNYHLVVPEFESGMCYSLRSKKVLEDYLEAKAQGIETRPVLLGQVSFVLYGKPTDNGVTRKQVLISLLPLYEELLRHLSSAGAGWVQIDEPCLCVDLDREAENFYRDAYITLTGDSSLPKLVLTTYFGDLGPNLDLALALGAAALHLDLVHAPKQLDALAAKDIPGLKVSLGLVDGRNIWRTDLYKAADTVDATIGMLGKDRVEIAPSIAYRSERRKANRPDKRTLRKNVRFGGRWE